MGREKLVVGIDIGTGSARAGAFTLDGRMLGSHSVPIKMGKPKPEFVEQSSEDIWKAACTAVRKACAQAKAKPEDVVGVSYDATCSLVALDRSGKPVTVSPTGEDEWNVVVWMDHRAIEQAERINSAGHEVLRYVGGRISPEMEPPKLLWIKENLPDTWEHTAKFFDLADFMVYRACGVDARSLCTVVCKWTYLGHEGEEGRWEPSFFEQFGLLDLFDGGRVPDVARPMGQRAGELTDKAAADMKLSPGTAVGVGIIDAHAGGLGSMGSVFEDMDKPDTAALETVLALIGGTSSCHMAVSSDPRYINGIWGPYYSAMVPGMWLTEGGQSATGGLVDYTIENNSHHPKLCEEAKKTGKTVYELLNEAVAAMGGAPTVTRELHVLPYHHGNRSPRADATLRGVVDGISLDQSVDSVAKLYYATVQAIAYGTRHIVESMNGSGYAISRIHACGGGTKNPLWLQEHADISGCDIYLPAEPEAVLLGTAILAAVASGHYADIPTAMKGMCRSGEVIRARDTHKAYHDAKYAVFHRMYEEQQAHRKAMAGF